MTPSAFHGRPRTGAATTDGPRTGFRGGRCAGLTFAAEVSVHVPASARCPASFAGAGGRGRADAVMGRVAVRESVTLAGRTERARAARRFVGEYSARGTRAEMTRSCWSARSSVILSGTAARVLRGRRSRSQSGPGTASSGSRSPIGPGRGCRSYVWRPVMRKAAGGLSLLRGWRPGGGGGGAAGGW